MSNEIVKKLLIYNTNNKYITAQFINNIFTSCNINYKINNLKHYQLALTHKSYIKQSNQEGIATIPSGQFCIPLQNYSNERLEYLGDSIIGSLVSSYIYHRYFRQNEGFLTKLKTKLVRTKTLSHFTQFLNLPQYILLSKHVEDTCNGRTNDAILENTFEAFIGAIFEDIYQNDINKYGYACDICNRLVIYLIEHTIDVQELVNNDDNYKEQLLQYFQKNFNGQFPIYTTLKEEGPTNMRLFTMGVYHPIDTSLLLGQGTSGKKTQAEQLASKQALQTLQTTSTH